jgi:hypothetical protein
MAAVDWHARARDAAFDGRALIDGVRRDALSGETFVKASPIDGRAGPWRAAATRTSTPR